MTAPGKNDLPFVFGLGIATATYRDTLLVPYAVRLTSQGFYSQEVHRLHPQTLADYFPEISQEAQDMVQILETTTEEYILKTYGGKKNKTFEHLVQDEKQWPFVLQYLDRRYARVLELAMQHRTPVFLAKKRQAVIKPLQFANGSLQPQFFFARQDSGIFYELRLNVQDKPLKIQNKELLVLANEPCWIVVESQILHAPNFQAAKLKPFLQKPSLVIPKAKSAEYFRKFIIPVIARHPVSAEGFTIEHENPDPQPQVLASVDPWTGNWGLDLHFEYNTRLGQKDFAYQSGAPSLILPVIGDEDYISVVEISRDSEREKRFANRIAHITGWEFNTHWAFDPDQSQQPFGLLDHLEEWESEFRDAGIQVKVVWKERQFVTSRSEIRIVLKEDDPDWFDLKGEIELAGFKFSFRQILPFIQRQDRIFPLPDGNFTLLPQEWFEKYRNLALFGSADGETIRLRKFHKALLPEMPVNYAIKKDTRFPGIQGITAQLRPYQLEGTKWMFQHMAAGNGACLADEMGLGKTIQTIALLQAFKNNIVERFDHPASQLDLFAKTSTSKKLGSILIVVPLSLVHNWSAEFRKFSPGFKIYRHGGAKRTRSRSVIANAEIVITTYGTLREDEAIFSKIEWDFIILDEAHHIKNNRTRTSQVLAGLKSNHKVILTGTPIENSLWDLWSLMQFINPGMLGNKAFFKQNFIHPIHRHDAQASAELQKLVKPFILRRTIREVAKELPDLIETVRVCAMAPAQKSAYEEEKSRVRNYILDQIQKGEARSQVPIILQSLTRLRQLANHPALVEGFEELESGKFKEVTRHINDLLAGGAKILVFSQFVSHLKLYARHLHEHHIGFSMLTGSMSSNEREASIRKFQENPDSKVFLVSLKAGGVGLNLTAASHVIILDPWWNPAVEKQAVSRAYRIGQQKNVIVYRFISAQTVEEKIRRLQIRKRELAAMLIDEDVPTVLQAEELLELVE